MFTLKISIRETDVRFNFSTYITFTFCNFIAFKWNLLSSTTDEARLLKGRNHQRDQFSPWEKHPWKNHRLDDKPENRRIKSSHENGKNYLPVGDFSSTGSYYFLFRWWFFQGIWTRLCFRKRDVEARMKPIERGIRSQMHFPDIEHRLDAQDFLPDQMYRCRKNQKNFIFP